MALCWGPLVWGRVAAYLEASVQTYVDDPLISLAGTRQQRDWAAAVTCLVWVMVGSDLAWKKARFGNRVSWIGAEFAVQNNGVIVSMLDDRVSKIRARLEEALRAKGMVAGLEELAGVLSWVAGLMPRIRPFCSHLWAAIHDVASAHARHRRDSTRKRPKNLVFIRQVRHALVWLLRFVEGERDGLRREYITPRSKVVTAVLRTDASTTGMAGILADQEGRPLEYWAGPMGLLRPSFVSPRRKGRAARRLGCAWYIGKRFCKFTSFLYSSLSSRIESIEENH